MSVKFLIWNTWNDVNCQLVDEVICLQVLAKFTYLISNGEFIPLVLTYLIWPHLSWNGSLHSIWPSLLWLRPITAYSVKM